MIDFKQNNENNRKKYIFSKNNVIIFNKERKSVIFSVKEKNIQGMELLYLIENNLLIIFAFEMTLINLYVSFLCSKKKYASFFTVFILIVFTVCLFMVMLLLFSDINGFGNGNGMIMLLGFLYLLPFYFLYRQSIKYTLTIMCLSWVYSFFIFALAIRIGYLFQEELFDSVILISQTLLYIITFPRFIRFIKNKFMKILDTQDDKTLNKLLTFGFLWFFTGIMINYIYVEGGTALLKLLSIFLLVFTALFSYNMFHSLVIMSNKTTTLIERTKTDTLTKLKNRDGFLFDAQNKINKRIPFSIVFIDLDNFKAINDKFGHSEGDLYLICFAETVIRLFHDFGFLYRLSGDEFIFLYEGKNVDEFCRELERRVTWNHKNGIRFRGLSSGCSTFPRDGSNLSSLMEKADFHMYQKKKEKHRYLDM